MGRSEKSFNKKATKRGKRYSGAGGRGSYLSRHADHEQGHYQNPEARKTVCYCDLELSHPIGAS